MSAFSKFHLVGENPGLEDEARKSIMRILTEEKLCCVSTLGPTGLPHLHTCYFASDLESGRIFYISDVKSKHSRNLIERREVAVSVFRQTKKWGDAIFGAQIEGAARIINETHPKSILGLYRDKFPESQEYLANGLVGDFSGSRIFEISIDLIKVIDEAEFGEDESITLVRIQN